MTTNMVRESAKILQFPVRNLQRLAISQGESLQRPVIFESSFDSWFQEQANREVEDKRHQ